MQASVLPVRRVQPATVLGLFLALFLPVASTLVGPLVWGSVYNMTRVYVGVLMFWLNLGLVLAVVRYGERRNFASIGWRAFHWWTVPLGVLGGVGVLVIGGLLISLLKVNDFDPSEKFWLALPVSAKLIGVFTAGIFEETLFRGYALERLTEIFRNKWAAALVTLLFFTLGHAVGRGLSNLLPILIVSIPITLLYLWRRDLLINIVAHIAFDAIQLFPWFGSQG